MPFNASLFDIAFWLVVLFIAALAFSIESGVVTRHRRVVVSSLIASTLTAVLMLFLVEDNSTFTVDRYKRPSQPVQMAQSGPGVDGTDGAQVASAEATGIESEPTGMIPGPGGLRDCRECPTVIVLDRGEIEIGSRETEAGRGTGEGPRKLVLAPRSFGLGKFEVLVSDYRQFVEESSYRTTTTCSAEGAPDVALTWDNPGFEQDERHPVVCVSMDDAKAYLLWMSEKTGQKYRLPSQAEWEYAARATTLTPYAFGGQVTEKLANFGRLKGATSEVGTFDANTWGLHDMHGNVWELTADCSTPDLTPVAEDTTPVGLAGDCTRHVIKGGGWTSPPEHLRSAARSVLENGKASPDIGFRLVRVM